MEGALAGGFQSWLGVDLLQTQDAQTGAVAHFRVRLALQDGTDDFGSGNANAFGPMNQSRRCPFQMRLVALGHRFGYGGMAISSGAAQVGSDARSTMEDLHRGRAITGLQLRAGQLVGDAV